MAYHIPLKNKYYLPMKERNYIVLVLAHVLIGFLIYSYPPLSKLYGYSILIWGISLVVKTRNKGNEVLLVSAYLVGSEVFLRMTEGNIVYEFSKYGVMLFLLLGMYYSGFSKNTIPFFIYLLLLFPGVIVATDVLNLRSEIHKSIAFNISGPVCLGVAAIYNYKRKISFPQLHNVLLAMGLPIISTTMYLFLYTPELKTILTSTGSNFATSGGFGPNQVATALGIGMFIFFSRLILESKTKLMVVVNVIIICTISYRGLLTFSRGGMITGIIIILILIVSLYKHTQNKERYQLNVFLIFFSLTFAFTWVFTSSQTGGLIDKRYANQDAAGRTKESSFTGREIIWDTEMDAFMDSPVFGVGVAKGKEIREEKMGELVVSHNEITRTIAEHGTLGIVALGIVFLVPFFLYFDNKQNIYMFCFLAFWLLTINHAAMRIAAPAFVYSLALLKVYRED